MRTGAIALVAGTLLARPWRGNLSLWPVAIVTMLWPAFGGHVLEVWFLNWLRPRIPSTRSVQLASRVAAWFVGGIVFAMCMRWTSTSLGNFPRVQWPPWWLGGLAFIGVEMVAHAALHLRGRPSVFDARG